MAGALEPLDDSFSNFWKAARTNKIDPCSCSTGQLKMGPREHGARASAMARARAAGEHSYVCINTQIGSHIRDI
jgi:hypothetical protein